MRRILFALAIGCLIFMNYAFADQWHPAEEIRPGTFGTFAEGPYDYKFPRSLNVTNQLKIGKFLTIWQGAAGGVFDLSGGRFSFSYANDEKMRLDSAGNLWVKGNVNVTGQLNLLNTRTRIAGFDGSGFHWFRYNPADDSDLIAGIKRIGQNNYNLYWKGRIITYEQTCPAGWDCHIQTWDIAAQSAKLYGHLIVEGASYIKPPYAYDIETSEWEIPKSGGAGTYYNDPSLSTNIKIDKSSVLVIWVSGEIRYDGGNPESWGYYRITVNDEECTGSHRYHESGTYLGHGSRYGQDFNTFCVKQVNAGTYTIKLQFSDDSDHSGRAYIGSRSMFVMAFNA
jgi:hypothetical protein